MSAAEVLMSSPRPSRLDPYVMSSSPSLPSLSDIISSRPQKPSLESGSRAATIPEGARTTFMSAASILRDAPEIDIETEKVSNSPPRKPKTTKARKKKSPTPETTSAHTDSPILIDSSPKEKPWQKYKGKKEAPKSNKPGVPKARVTKPNTKRKLKENPETVSRHFAAKESLAKPAEEKAEEKADKGKAVAKLEDEYVASGSSLSESALRRRDNWTPPPADSPLLIGPESDNRELHSSSIDRVRSKDVFNTLLDEYGRKDGPSSITTEQLQVDVLKKRKLIELVSTRNGSEQGPIDTSPVKVVNAKKKTRTITELAMAPYMMPIGPELDLAGPSTKESLLNYFDSDGAVKALVEHQTAVMSQKNDKAKIPKAATKPKRKKKAGTANNPILLSPNSALKQSSNQDFVFGTSSQLVREDSPSMLRDLQSAIQASNQADSDPFVDSDSQGLWHAGARDVDGDLMNLDDVELVADSPSLPRRGARPSRKEFVDIHDILKSSELDESATTAPPENSHFFQSQVVPNTQPSRAEDRVPVDPEPAVETTNPRPDYESLTDVQLARQIASYGFKPVKKRQAMIALLDQCWASKSSVATTNQSRPLSTSSTMDAPKKKQQAAAPESEQPPKRRGRPRKQSTVETSSTTTKAPAPEEASPKRAPRGRPKASASKAVEIADSDLEELVSSSSRASSPDGDRIFSSPPAVDLSLTEDADLSLLATTTTSSSSSATDQQADLFRHITKAVTMAPPSRDPARPSWHEKMLLYDPIVLEDLAAWLNGGALGEVGYDGEASAADVKRWCESKSVICLWQKNLRGKERKRY
ncbi:hypothetical protein GGR53DRAFT_479110 [Hypoxylon sp. FL1150]|nr:hypothetical protein GGR53DRAFT_479110 [Hypoxylon sp. FL1150]